MARPEISLVFVGLDASLEGVARAAAQRVFGAINPTAVASLEAALAVPASPGGLGAELLILGRATAALVTRATAAVDAGGLPRWTLLARASEESGPLDTDALVLVPAASWQIDGLGAALAAAAALHTARRELARARGDLRTVARTVAHELRAPLGCALTSAEMLHEVLAEEAPAQAELTRPIIDSAHEAVKLLERVCFILRASAIPRPPQPVDMGDVFHTAWERWQSRLLPHGARLTQPDRWPVVTGVASWLETIWSALLGNVAVHGGPAPCLEAGWSAEPAGGHRFWLSDHGPGVPATARAGLFTPFHRLHEFEAVHGLGLSIMQRLVGLHGGTCGHEVTPGGGATFFFTVPAAPARPSPNGREKRAVGRVASTPVAAAPAPDRLRDPARLAAVAATGWLDSAPADRLDRITALASRTLRAPIALVSLVDGQHSICRAAHGLPEPWATRRDTPFTPALCRHVVATEAPLEVADARHHPLVQEQPAAAEWPLGAYLGVPLRTPDGHTVGALCVLDRQPRAWSAEDRSTLEDLAALVAAEFDTQAQVAAREAATAAAQRAEEQMRGTLDALASHVAILDRHGTILAVNRAWQEFATANGYTGTDCGVGTNYLDACAPSPVQGSASGDFGARETAAAIRAVARGERTTFVQEYSCHSPDTQRWFQLRVSRFSHGENLRIVVTHEEITARRQAEETQRAQAAQLRLVTENAPTMIAHCDRSGRFLFVNRSYAQRFDLDPADVVGRTVHDVLGAPACTISQPYVDRVLAGEAVNFETEMPLPRLGRRFLRTSYVPDTDEHGAVRGWLVAVTDLTERKRAEDASRQLAAIVESSDDAIISKDLRGIITSWNAAAERLYGYTAAEVIGQPITMLIPPERHDEEPGILARIMRGERIEHYETVRRRRDGTDVEISLSVSPLKDEAGRIVGSSKIARDIGAARRAAAELRHRDRLYRAIGESIDYGIWICDASGRNTYASDSFLRLVGLTQEECSGDGWGRVLHPEQVAPTLAAWTECVRTGERWEREHLFKGVDGEWHPVLARGVSIRDERGAIVCWAGINLDISAFKRAEATLARRTSMLETLNQVGDTLVAERDLGKIVQAVTDAGRELSGAAFGAFVYHLVDAEGEAYQLFALSGGPRVAVEQFGLSREILSPAFDGSQILRVADLLTERPDLPLPSLALPDEQPPVRSYLAVPVTSRSGEVLGGLFFGHPQPGVFTEESEAVVSALAAQAAIAIDNARLYAALQRELAEQHRIRGHLEANERQLRLITDHALVYICHLDREYRYRFVNRAYAQRFGRSATSIVGQTVSEVTGPAAFAAVQPRLDEALAGQRVEFEMEIPYAQIGPRWVHVTFEPERTAAGAVVGLVAVTTDITERKRFERELEQARDRALDAARTKDDFLAALSHELRTPLNPVLLLAGEAADNPALPPEVRADFATIRKNVELEARLIDDLLDLTRITRGKLALTPAIHDLHVILRDALATVQADIEQKHLTLLLELAPTPALVWGDAVRLQQIFWNVLKNAVKFTPEAGRITVRTQPGSDGHSVVLSVTDTGIGMAPHELTRIFEAFTQGDHAASGGSHRFGGVGLGLAISRMIAELHDGAITATSDGPGCGSTFRIELPLYVLEAHDPAFGTFSPAIGASEADDPSAPPRPAAVPTPADAPPAVALPLARVLLVEDHEPTRSAVARLLTRRHYDVVTAGSVAEARHAAQHGSFAFLVSDIGLPDGSGYELMAEFRAAYGLGGIALTGYGTEHDIARSQAAGFAVHITKPVRVQALDAALSTLSTTS